jgi:hypothetical protein
MINPALIVAGVVFVIGCVVLWRKLGLRSMLVNVGFLTTVAVTYVIVERFAGAQWSWVVAVPVLMFGALMYWKRQRDRQDDPDA